MLEQVFFGSDPTWFWPFVVMLTLAAGVAAVGLVQDSAASVIGSMVINPLGSPIAAFGGATALGWPREIGRSLVCIAMSVVVVGVGYIIGLFIIASALTDQILARTDPDLRDFSVAVFAGAAAGFARTRKELSSTLVGVAVAVAVVPPLAAVGLLLEDGRPLLARGALLLFSANLVGISGAVAVVMLLMGYAPRPQIPRTWPARALALGIVVGAVAVLVPLYQSYRALSTQSVMIANVTRAVKSEIEAGSGITIKGVYPTSNEFVEVDLGNTGSRFNAEDFARKMTTAMGGSIKVSIRTE